MVVKDNNYDEIKSQWKPGNDELYPALFRFVKSRMNGQKLTSKLTLQDFEKKGG